MSKKLTMLSITLLVFGCMAWAADNTWTGTVSDEHCGAKKHDLACLKKCVDGGAKYVLVSKGKVYKVDPQDKFAEYAGKHVKVTGDLKDDTITATEVAAAGLGMHRHKKSEKKAAEKPAGM